jgi:serine/threonine-protein kinase PknG
MAEQLTGVLREILAVGDGSPRPAFSALFSPELQAIGAAAAMDTGGAVPRKTAPQVRETAPPAPEIIAGLPVPQVDNSDPASGYLATLSTLDPAQRTAVLRAAVTGEPGTPREVTESAETRLALARALIVADDLDDAATALTDLVAGGLADWRTTWYQGLCELAAARPDTACAAFDAVCDALPGELPPKLALAFAIEAAGAAGDRAAAAHYFQLVWTVDRSYVSAAFGLARVRLAAGDQGGAIAALAAVPETSSHHVAAQIAAVRIHMTRRDQAGVSADDLREAGIRLARLDLDAARKLPLAAEILRGALDCVVAGKPVGNGQLLGCELSERGLRFGLEKSYRALARLVPDEMRRIELVDLANEVRPRTWS